MSWIEQLSRTYDACYGQPQFAQRPLAPISTVPQTTQLHVRLYPDSNFHHASIEVDENTTLFVSEDSATRSGTQPAPNPLTEQLEYCAKGVERFGGKDEKYRRYLSQLKAWSVSMWGDPKITAVLRYIEGGTLLDDLLRERVLSANGNALEKAKIEGKKLQQDPLKLWVRWSVIGENQAETWSDAALAEKWRQFESSQATDVNFCMASGEKTRTTQKHPARIRSTSDRSKLISANDKRGFTFCGRFVRSQEALTVGYETSQKAHNALRWLVERQGASIGERVIVAWSVTTASPQPLLVDTWDMFRQQEDENTKPATEQIETLDTAGYAGDAGQLFALRLRKAIFGYRQEIGHASDAVVMVLDSATDGRMAIPYYREMPGWDLLDRIERWHSLLAWMQTVEDGKQLVGAPSPIRIVDTVYGRIDREHNSIQIDKKLRSAMTERLIPCIIDGHLVPRDLARSAFNKTIASAGRSKGKDQTKRHYWEFDSNLGVACSLHKATHPEENYEMSLEEGRTTRDYLFGRLLALADSIESMALRLAEQTRETSALRLMQRFASHPAATWKTIRVEHLMPYIVQLQKAHDPFPMLLNYRLRLIDKVTDSFQIRDGESEMLLPGDLSPEFLLGYSCQREALRPRNPKSNPNGAGQESAIDAETEKEGEDQ